MSAYLSEEEQVEAIKKWWRDNAKSVISGVVVGIGIIFGWQWWLGQQATQADNASMLFDSLQNRIVSGQIEQADADAAQLLNEYGDTAYAAFGAMHMAKQAYAQGDKADARTHLERAQSTAADPALAELARLRLVNLLLDMNELDAAAAQLQADSELMPGEFAQLRGDLASARGDLTAAKAAYEEAMALGVSNARLLRMKLIDAGGADS